VLETNKLEHICLIKTKRYTWSKNKKIKKNLDGRRKYLKAYYSQSLSLLTIASLTPRNIKVTYLDEAFEEIDFNVKYDLVGISAMTQESIRAYEVAEEFRKRNVYVVMGGIHVSFMPEEALKWVDTVIIGEAEYLWPQFLDDFKKNKMRKIYRNPPGTIIDLRESPIPRYDLLEGKKYFMNPKYFYNFVPVQATRGCPHGCEFCVVSKMFGLKLRKKTIEQVKAEILEIKKYYPNKLLFFADDNLFIDKKYSKKLMKALKDLKVRWWAQTDISVGDDQELLSLAYESGALFFLIGFESVNPDNLKQINKNSWKYTQFASYAQKIRTIQQHGIIVFGAFIFGLDHDDKTVFKNVVDFMDKNNITGQLTIATPLPGSDMLKRLEKEGRLLEKNIPWDKCTFLDVLFKPKKMTVTELEDGFIWAYKQVFNEEAFKKRAVFLKNIYKNLQA